MVMGIPLGSTLVIAIGMSNAKASKTFPVQKVSLAVDPVDGGIPPPQTWLKNFE